MIKYIIKKRNSYYFVILNTIYVCNSVCFIEVQFAAYLIFFFFFLPALGLHCCAWAFSSCGEQGYSLLQCAGFSLRWLLLLRSMGSRYTGFSSCGTWAQ